MSNCPICGYDDTHPFLDLKGLPTQDGVVFDTRDRALRAPTGDVQLVLCMYCSYVWNRLHDPSLVDFGDYDFSLHYSPAYSGFVQALVEDLVEHYGVRHKTVLDIGCGQGDFLREICRMGENRGIGIDPSYGLGGSTTDDDVDVAFYRDYYSEKYAGIQADLVTCRHVIDEIDDCREFLETIRRCLEQRGHAVAYIELPDFDHTLKNCVVWNIGYAKRSWFTRESLSYLLESCGFEVVRTYSSHGQEYLSAEGMASAHPDKRPVGRERAAARMCAEIQAFQREAEKTVAEWEQKVDALRGSGVRAIAWGAGQRAINFLNHFDLRDELAFVVDVNPNRQGRYLPRSGHRVEAPERALEYRPELVLITNPTYADEIEQQIASFGLEPEYLVL